MDATTHEADGVETVENAAKPIQEPESTRRVRVLGSTCWWGKFGNVADVQDTTSASSIESVLQNKQEPEP